MASANATAMFSRVVLTATYVAVGYALQRFGALKREDGEVMLRFVVNVTLPAMLLHTLSHTGVLFGPGVPLVWLSAAFGTAVVAGGAALMYRKTPSHERGLLVGAACGANLGTFAFPFVEAIWGVEGLRLAALYDVPNAVAVFCVASAVFAAERRVAIEDQRAAAARHDDGGVYRGEWSARGESKQGVGVYEYPSGAIYEGQWSDNRKEGFGVYRFAKGGSYAGEFKRGVFDGMGLRFLRNGGVKSGRFREGEFIEALGVKASDLAASKAAEFSKLARHAAEKTKSTETETQFAQRMIWKIVTFPPFLATLLALGSPESRFPGPLLACVSPLAEANGPLTSLTLGVLLQPFTPKRSVRIAFRFLATKYAFAFLGAASVAAAIPPIAGSSTRFILPALLLMPVSPLVMRYALDNEGDVALAGCMVTYSQIVSLIVLCALGVAGAFARGASSSRWILPGCLAAAGCAVAGLGVVADRLLAPKRMVFRPKTGKASATGEASDGGENVEEVPPRFAAAPPDDDGAGPIKGSTATSAFGSRKPKRVPSGVRFRASRKDFENGKSGGIGTFAPRLVIASPGTFGKPRRSATRMTSGAASETFFAKKKKKTLRIGAARNVLGLARRSVIF